MPTFSFQNPLPTLAFTKPKALRIGVDIFETSTWAKVLEEAARAMLDGAPTRKAALAAAKRFPWMGRSGRGMTLPGELEPGVWIELHQNSYTILIRMKMLFEYCGYPLDQASLEYETGLNDELESCKTRQQKKVRCPDERTLVEPVQPALFGPSSPGQPSLFRVNRPEGQSSSERVGEWAKREFKAALSEERIPDKDFDALCTKEGTKALLGIVPNCCPVFGHSPIVDKKGRNRCWKDDPATRNGKPVYVNSQWYDRDRPKLERLFARWSGPNHPTQKRESAETNETAPPSDMKRFLDDIREHWPDGFDFSDGAVRLLEGRCGPLGGEMKKRLKSAMFRRRDKLWFPADAVAPSSLRKEAVSRAKELLSEWGFFSTVVVADLFDTPDVHLRDDRDREDFVAFLLPAEDGYLRLDQGAVQIVVSCRGRTRDSIQQALDEYDSVASDYAQRVRSFIAEACGTASYEDVCAAFPNLGKDSLLELLADKAPDIVPEADDEGHFAGFKLLSEFYLPDDIAPVLLSILERGEKSGKVLSSSFINTELGVHYGCDFATDYALDPAYSLKWALEAVYRTLPAAPHRVWDGKGAGARFVRSDDEDNSPPTEAAGGESVGEHESKWDEKYRLVCEKFPGIVTLEEYADFFVESFGLQRITAYAHVSGFFVRLDSERAVTKKAFEEKSSWTDADGEELESALRDRMGNAPFLPIASLPESFFDSLPAVSFEGTPLKWTHELLEGITWHFAPSVPRMNYYASWNLVSTFLLPERALGPNDEFPNEVEYALGVYCDRNLRSRSVDGAFAFLRDNAIRVRLRGSLRKQIEAFLAKREGDA